MPIVVKGLQNIPLTREKPIGVTLTIHDNGVVTIEKTHGEPIFTILRGRLLGMDLSSIFNAKDYDKDDKNSFEVITFYLSQEFTRNILCPIGTFNRLKNEVFQM